MLDLAGARFTGAGRGAGLGAGRGGAACTGCLGGAGRGTIRLR